MLDITPYKLELAYVDHLSFLQKLRKEKSLTVDELEIILTKALLDIKSEKEASTSSNVIQLMYQVQQLEDEKKKLLQKQSMQVVEESKKEK